MAGLETVLLYNFNDDKKLRSLKMIFLRMGVRMRVITPDMYLEPIGALAHIKGFTQTGTRYEGPGFSDEMLVMNGFSNARLDELLHSLRKNHVERIHLKAVVTAHNASWNSLELHGELTKEHQMMTKAPMMDAVVYQKEGVFALEKRRIPKLIDPTDAIVKVTLASICTSDLHIKHGSVPKAVPGIVVGHEMVGEIVSLGSDVPGFKSGDRVAVNVETFCGTCFFCRNGYVNNCVEGGWELGCRIDGCQAEYVRVPIADMGMTLIPDDVKDEDALFNGDILATGYWAASIGELKPADTVVVIGAGPTGLCTLMSVKLYSPSKVILIDVNDYRLNLAKEQGLADIIVNSSKEDPLEVIMRETNGRGADRVFEVAGLKSTFQLAWQAARPNAIVVIVALYAEPQEIPLQLMYGKNLTFKTGGVDGNSNYAEEIMRLIQTKQIDTSCLITHKAPLNDVMRGYEVFENKIDNCVKWVITPYER